MNANCNLRNRIDVLEKSAEIEGDAFCLHEYVLLSLE